jgi:hypothetical protein
MLAQPFFFIRFQGRIWKIMTAEICAHHRWDHDNPFLTGTSGR